MNESTHRLSRLSGALLASALLASVLSITAVAGQGNEDAPALEPIAAPVLPSATVAVVGDGLLAGSNVAPLRDADCRASTAGPVEQAAAAVGETVVRVENLACDGASLRDLSREQIPQISPDADRVIVGGAALEFDWLALERACLSASTRTPDDCVAASEFARATAANSFFSWRSALQQIARTAPDAEIAVVSGPSPVGAEALLLGSACCDERVDGHGRVQAVFETAEASRTAVIESLPDLPIVVVDAMAAFAGHASTDADPWLVGADAPAGLVSGLPNASGVAVIASLLGPMMPVGPTPPERPAAPAREVALIVASSDATASAIAAVDAAADGWLAEATAPTVWILPVTEDPAPEDPAPEDPAPEDPPAGLQADPPADDPPADDPPADDPPAEEQPPIEEPTPVVATTGEELRAALASIPVRPTPTVTAAELAAQLEAAGDLPWSDQAHRSLVVILDGFSGDDAQVSTALAALDVASTVVITPTVDDAVALGGQLAATDAAIVALTDAADIGSSLPVPPVPDDLLGIDAPPAIGILGRSLPVAATIDTAFATDAVVTWATNEGTVGVGQTTVIDASRLPAGTRPLTVTATSDTSTVTMTTTLSITRDGDGLEGESCGAFDPSEVDSDGDLDPDACDSDDDNDGIPDTLDPCDTVPNTRLLDSDRDGRPNVCDSDNADGPGADFDGDGTPDVTDNCPAISNADQANADSDDLGDACETPVQLQCTITGTARADVLIGTPGDDVICGLGGDDELIGNGGDDLLIGGPGNDVLRGHEGDDRLLGGAGDDILLGRSGDDVLVGGAGEDRLEGDEGDDLLDGSLDADRLNGDDGNDILFGGPGADDLNGGNGNDVLVGGRGNDTLLGKNGDDTAHGEGGADRVRTGSGNDTIIDSRTVDSVSPGGGTDLIGGSSSVVVG